MILSSGKIISMSANMLWKFACGWQKPGHKNTYVPTGEKIIAD
jgi:hypothetical protein